MPIPPAPVGKGRDAHLRKVLDTSLPVVSLSDRQSARPPPAPTIRSFRVPVTGRCFNSAGLENLLEPVFPDEPADMFYTAMETHRPAVEGLIKAVDCVRSI